MSRLHRVSSPATWSSLKGWTKFRTARASMFRRPARRDLRLTMSPHETAEAAVKVVVPVDEAGEDEARGRANEYLQTVHRSSGDRKSTRLNSSHQIISYAVLCVIKQNEEN